MKDTIRCAFLALALLSFSGCFLKPAGDSPSADPATSLESGGGSITPASETNLMNCTTTNGADSVDLYPVAFVPAISGTAITSVTLNLYLSDSGGVTDVGQTSGTVTLNAYTCASAGSLGSSAGTAVLATSLNYSSTAKTFTFTSPINIPSNCQVGEAPFAIVISHSAYNSDTIWAKSGANTTACYLKQSSSGTGAVARSRGYTAVIKGNP